MCIHLHVARFLRQLSRDFLDDLVARIADRVDRMAKPDHDLLRLDALANVGFGLVRVLVTLLDLERDFVGAAMLRSTQRADRAGDARVDVGAGARDHTTRERRGVEFVLGVQDQRDVHRLDPGFGCRAAMQQVQEVPADRVIVGLDRDSQSRMAVVIPVAQHRAKARDEAVGDVARASRVVIVFLRKCAAQHRRAGAQYVHRMTRSGQCFQRGANRSRQSAQPLQFGLVAFSSARFGILPCTSRCATSSNSHWSAMSRMS